MIGERLEQSDLFAVAFLNLGDRASIEDSRKWGIYNTTNLMFKTYFKVRVILSLSAEVI